MIYLNSTMYDLVLEAGFAKADDSKRLSYEAFIPRIAVYCTNELPTEEAAKKLFYWYDNIHKNLKTGVCITLGN